MEEIEKNLIISTFINLCVKRGINRDRVIITLRIAEQIGMNKALREGLMIINERFTGTNKDG